MELSLNTPPINGTTSFAGEQLDISKMLTMSSIEIDTDMINIAKNLYRLDNIRTCICDQKYSSYWKCKACAQLQ
eukprot:2280938-Ditylum_brightwellii.AAC.1